MRLSASGIRFIHF